MDTKFNHLPFRKSIRSIVANRLMTREIYVVIKILSP